MKLTYDEHTDTFFLNVLTMQEELLKNIGSSGILTSSFGLLRMCMEL
jgi:hypothetical protein